MAQRDMVTGDAEPTRADSSRRLMGLLLVGNTALVALYAGVISILLPTQVQNIDRPHRVALLGITASVSAVFAMAFNPIGGTFSDRTRSRFGRRHPWIFGGALAVFVLVIPLGFATSILLLAILWCLVQAAANVYQAALTAVVPDRVPISRRGTASALTGAASPLGLALGIGLAGIFVDHVAIGYLILGLLLLAAALSFVILTRDPPRGVPPARRCEEGTGPAGFLSAFTEGDFRWAFIGRALMMLGFFMITSYLLYLLEDRIRLPRDLTPSQGVAVLSGVSAAAMVVGVAVCGPLSDLLGSRKLFVVVSSVVTAAALMLPLLSDRWSTTLVFAALDGGAFGAYLAVDTAIMTLVLPKEQDNARDMGVLNIANAGPQVGAPLIASLAINELGGYDALFVLSAALAIAGALAILPIKSVR